MKTSLGERLVITVVAFATAFVIYSLIEFLGDTRPGRATTPTTVGWCPEAHPDDPQWSRIEAKLDCLGERP